MFVGYVDNQLLFATSQPKGKEIISGTLTDEINSVSALEFTLPPSNDAAGQITPHASVIRLESDGAEIFRGTANSVSKNFRGDTVVSCDGMIALMADVIRAPGTVSGVNTKSYINALITNYNAGVADNRHISSGIIDEFGTFTADHSQECKNIFELLKEVLSEKGGYIWASYVGGDVRINYTSTIGRRNNQQIAFGSNLVNIEDQLEVGTLVTRVWPLGKDGLTIASVNNNIIYLQNEEVELRYGRVDKTIQVDSDDPSVVKSYGQAYLTRYAAMNNTITLTAIDLHNLDKKISSFEVGDAVRVLSPPHGIDAEMIVNSVSTDLVQLSNSRITLGGKKGSITSVISSGGGSGGSGGFTGGGGGGVIGGGASIVVDSALSLTSTNPVENKVITAALAGKASTATATQSSAGLMSAADKAKLDSLTSKDNIVHADIPDYIKAAAMEVAKKVQAVRTSESIVFIAASDAHQLDTSADIVNGNLHAGMAMKAITYILPGIDFACYLGDYTAGSATTTLAEGRQHFAEINADIDEAFSGIPQFRTLGNHDSLQYSKAQNGSVLSASELYGLCGAYNTGAVIGSTTEGYCYRDFESKKLRVICLNTAEDTEKEYVSDAQKLWFANTLKAVGAKAGWNVLILSHHPLDWGGVCILSNIVKAYVDGGSITVSSGNTVDFSGSNSAKILAAIHGHVHCFKAAKLNAIASGTGTEYNVWRVATPNMCFARNNEYGQNGNAEYYGIEFGETTTYNKTANSANDTAFVVNVINPSQQKIYSYCYGAGYDREIFTGIQTVAVTGVTLNAASGELTIGGQTTLTATVSPADASNKTVTWTSSAPAVASVVNGVVTALAPGSAKITVKTADGGFTAEYALTVKAATSDLLASYGYADNTRLSTSSGSEKAAAGYVTIGHTAAIPIDKTRYPNGATIRVTGAVNCLGNNWSGANNGGDSAFALYTTGGTQFSNASYIEAGVKTAGTFTIDADKTGFTLDIASLSAPHYIKFCVKGAGANLTATLTPK